VGRAVGGKWRDHRYEEGDYTRAHSALESLIVAREWGFSSWTIASVLVYLAGHALADGRPERAMRLAGAACGVREKHQGRLQPTDADRLEAVLDAAPLRGRSKLVKKRVTTN
jgi:hypothetical protein